MDEYSKNSGFELVLDNRRLIVVFGVLFVSWLGFFLFGFVEGKRQGLKAATENVTLSSAGSTMTSAPVQGTATVNSKIGEATTPGQLDWYKNVNQGAASKTKLKEPSAQPASRVTYSVQVGAFKNRREAEVRARALKAKGYNSVIEPSASGNQLFHLKVGKFDSRADAAAMQLQLKKDGFATLIKTNP